MFQKNLLEFFWSSPRKSQLVKECSSNLEHEYPKNLFPILLHVAFKSIFLKLSYILQRIS